MFSIVPMGDETLIFNSASEYIVYLFFQCLNFVFEYLAQFGRQDFSFYFIHSLRKLTTHIFMASSKTRLGFVGVCSKPNTNNLFFVCCKRNKKETALFSPLGQLLIGTWVWRVWVTGLYQAL